MPTEAQVFSRIERSAIRAYPDVTKEQAVARYLSEHPGEYQAYLAAAPADPDALEEEIIERATANYPQLSERAAVERYTRANRNGQRLMREWKAAGGVQFHMEPEPVSDAERRFSDAAQRAYPSVDEATAMLRYSHTPEGARLLAEALG